jgi:ATP-dependent 26S proteasome regulatory subunit
MYGEREAGKSYTSMLLKKELDKRYPNTNVRLYDDFNPMSIGVDIQEMSLQYASNISPIVILIDEIDTIFEHVLKDKNDYDPRIKHARDRSTFHKMLDNLGQYHHVIVIYTTEFSPDELYKKNPLYKSFMRPGRIDMAINLTKTRCTHDENYWQRLKEMKKEEE